MPTLYIIQYTHIKTPQAENDDSHDYKQFKSQEADQQDLHHTNIHMHAHTHTNIHITSVN